MFPNKKYQIIYADPGWQFDNKRTGGSMSSGSAQQYTVNSIQDICNLPVKEIADDNCMLFMWWVASQPQEALDVVKAWDFNLKTMTGFTWVKKTKHNKPWFGMGFQTRQGSENCLIAAKGNIKRISASVRAVVQARVPVDENNKYIHSAKPAIFRDLIVELMGDLPRIELFSRNDAPGWDHWGDGK